MSLRLIIVRDADTTWAHERRFAGSRDVPPAADGRRQADAAARTLAGLAPAAIHASPLQRARAMAEMIGAVHGLDVQVDQAFRDMHFGAWEGLTLDEATQRFPAEAQAWRSTPDRFRAPGGESLPAVAQRARAGVAALREAHPDDTVVLVTHAVVARLLVLDALGLGPERLWSVDASPAGISELEYRDDWVTVHRMNTLTHLVPDPAAVAG
jgi:broad specificity phosphatase PhoE